MENIDYTKNINSDEAGENRGEKKKVNIYKYDDVEGGVSTKQLDFGVWFVNSKKFFINSFIFLLIIISAVSWSYSIYHIAYYLAKGMNEDRVLLADLSNNTLISHDYIEKISAKNISASSVLIFPLGESKFDFAVELKNPNIAYWVNFDYCFLSEDQNIACGSGFLMPGEKKYIIELAKEINSGSKNVKFVIENISWQRINLHKYSNWNDFTKEHLDIVIENIDFKSIVQSGLSDKIGYNSLDFSITNKTPYNYWSVDLDIFLRRADKIISVNKYNLQEFMSGENRKVEINWPGKLSNISDIKIIPIINILDQNNYIDFESKSSLLK